MSHRLFPLLWMQRLLIFLSSLLPSSGWDEKSLPPSHKHFLYTAAEVQRNSPLQSKAQAQDLDLFQCYLLQNLAKTPLILDSFGSWHQPVWFPGAASHELILRTQQKTRSHYLCTLFNDSLMWLKPRCCPARPLSLARLFSMAVWTEAAHLKKPQNRNKIKKWKEKTKQTCLK